MLNRISEKQLIIFLVSIAFIIRLTYVFIGVYYSDGLTFFLNGDSDSYTLSFKNLVSKGIYSFDLETPDAAFGRLPGYPFFWGLHYIVFGDYAYHAVAFTQAILDSVVVALIYYIVNGFTKDKLAALLGALIYVGYIFSIFWVPVTGTESLGVFITVIYLYVLSKENYKSLKWYFILGIICAYAFYTREYIGVLFPITGVYFLLKFLKRQINFKGIFVYAVTFSFLYILWPIRNYVSYSKIELLKPVTAGYTKFQKDFSSYRSWMYCWHTGVEPYFSRILAGKPPDFPKDVIESSGDNTFLGDSIYISNLIDKAVTCGSSFYAWKFERLGGKDCNEAIANGFKQMKLNFIREQPLTYYLKVPALNFGKALFKNSLTNEPVSSVKKILISILFGWRSLLVILGFVGLFYLRKNVVGFVITIFPIFMYVFICYFMRQVEMRYLLQADVCLIISSIVGMSVFVKKGLLSNQRNKKSIIQP